MAYVLAFLFLFVAPPDSCDIPPKLAERHDSDLWEHDPEGSKMAISDFGWLAVWSGDTCDPDAIAGHDGGRFVWMRPMKGYYEYETNPAGDVTMVADGLYHCLQSGPIQECRLLRDLLIKELEKAERKPL